MTDTADNDIGEVAPASEADWQLRGLVAWANNMSPGSSLGVTLFVGGLIVTGQLIGGREYFELFGDTFSESLPTEELRQGIRDEFQAVAERLYGPPRLADEEDQEEDEDDEALLPTFIHLKDAYVVQSGAPLMPGNRGLLWRGRLVSVDGWSLGVLSEKGD